MLLAINTASEKRHKSMGVCKSHLQKVSFLLGCLIFTLALFLPNTLRAFDYYVSPTGNDANEGTIKDPFRSIKVGLQVLNPGDTLFIRGGTYSEILESHNGTNFPSGTSEEPVIVRAFRGEQVTLVGRMGIGFEQPLTQYVAFEGITIDATGLDTGIAINGGSHHIVFMNGEVRNANQSGLYLSYKNDANPDNVFNKFLNMHVHHNGTDNGIERNPNSGFYIKTSGNLIEKCQIHDNFGWGILNNVRAEDPRRKGNIFRYNRIKDNGRGGITINGGVDNHIYNNIVWKNQNGILVGHSGSPIGTKVYHNTLYANQEYGISVLGAIDTEVINNISYKNLFYNLYDAGRNTTAIYNLIVGDPNFVDPANGDFHLRESSPAIGKGVPLKLVKMDFDGRPRFQLAPTLGAFGPPPTLSAPPGGSPPAYPVPSPPWDYRLEGSAPPRGDFPTGSPPAYPEPSPPWDYRLEGSAPPRGDFPTGSPPAYPELSPPVKDPESSPPDTTGQPKRDGGDTKKLPEIVWNLWADRSLHPYDPVPHLSPNTTYRLVLHLSAISYAADQQGVYTRAPDQPFRRQVAAWLDDEKRSSTNFDVYLIHDPDYFLMPTTSKETMSINLNKLRARRTAPPLTISNPLRALKQTNDPEFVYGRIAFEITTGSIEGIASLAFSLWDKVRPLDELGVNVCIASEEHATDLCQHNQQVQFGLKGIDTVRVAVEAGNTQSFPDAALHFFAFNEQDKVIGVFRRNDRPDVEPVFWRLKENAEDLYAYLQKTQLDVFTKVKLDDFPTHGRELYNLLFPPKETKAREVFEAFVAERGSADGTASIFVRMVDPGRTPPLLIPLGLVFVNTDFLGFRFRIETPLQVQRYQPDENCISRWIMAIPTSDKSITTNPELKLARDHVGAFSPWIEKAEKVYDHRITEFGNWLQASKTAPEPSTGLITLSHHANNKLWYTDDDYITSKSVVREFTKPSLAILNGCKTGEPGPGAADFIRNLNANGVGTVIATNQEVDPTMAGQFLDCLGAELGDSTAIGKKTIISHLYYQTLKCLKNKNPRAEDPGAPGYGARVLAYTLMGNGNLRVCPPKN